MMPKKHHTLSKFFRLLSTGFLLGLFLSNTVFAATNSEDSANQPFDNQTETTNSDEPFDDSVKSMSNETNQEDNGANTQEKNTESSTQETSNTSELRPAPDVISCTADGTKFNVATQGKITLNCTVKTSAYVTARIMKGTYAPNQTLTADQILKDFDYEVRYQPSSITYVWDGINNYDDFVEPGEYSFVIQGQPDLEEKSDYSIKKITVENLQPEPQTTESTQENTQESQEQQPQEPTPLPPEPSKCPGVNYPSDIADHWGNEAIRAGYDGCFFRGYPDGTFHPNQPVTRAEAVKMALSVAGIKPNSGCFDNDCGTPFLDIFDWQSGWIKAAYDQKIITGTSAYEFSPNRTINRGDSSVLIAKAFQIEPFKNCYTPNCGAGQPDNIFADIYDITIGQYLRPLADKKIIQGTAPNTFEPSRPVTRAEFAKILMGVKTQK